MVNKLKNKLKNIMVVYLEKPDAQEIASYAQWQSQANYSKYGLGTLGGVAVV